MESEVDSMHGLPAFPKTDSRLYWLGREIKLHACGLGSPQGPLVGLLYINDLPINQSINQIFINQILFRNNKDTYTLAIKTVVQNKKCCYVVVTWHIMCRLPPVTPKHKLIKYRHIYTYTRKNIKSLFSI